MCSFFSLTFFSFFSTNFSIKIHSPKRSTDYGTSLSQVTSEVTSPSYPHFTSARNTFLETKKKLTNSSKMELPGIAAHTLSQNSVPFSHEVHEVQSIAPPGYKHKSIHINSMNSQRIHSGTFHQFHSLKKIVWCFVFQLSHFYFPKFHRFRTFRTPSFKVLGPGHGFRHLGEADQECRVPLRQPWRHFQMSKKCGK